MKKKNRPEKLTRWSVLRPLPLRILLPKKLQEFVEGPHVVHVIRMGEVEAVIWRRKRALFRKGYYSVSLQRRYFWKKYREYRTTPMLGRDHLPLAAKALQEALHWILQAEDAWTGL